MEDNVRWKLLYNMTVEIKVQRKTIRLVEKEENLEVRRLWRKV